MFERIQVKTKEARELTDLVDIRRRMQDAETRAISAEESWDNFAIVMLIALLAGACISGTTVYCIGWDSFWKGLKFGLYWGMLVFGFFSIGQNVMLKLSVRPWTALKNTLFQRGVDVEKLERDRRASQKVEQDTKTVAEMAARKAREDVQREQSTKSGRQIV